MEATVEITYISHLIIYTRNQCATGSKILTEPEPDRIGIILAGTGPDRITSQKKLTGFSIGLAGFLPDF